MGFYAETFFVCIFQVIFAFMPYRFDMSLFATIMVILNCLALNIPGIVFAVYYGMSERSWLHLVIMGPAYTVVSIPWLFLASWVRKHVLPERKF